MDALQTYLDQAERLPSLPGVAFQLLALARSDTASAAAAARVAEADPALVARLLRTVNSAAFGLRRNIVSTERAIALLGLRPVAQLAVGFSVVHQFKPTRGEQILHAQIWRHSVTAGLAARLLAQRVAPSRADDAFLAGLLADLGRVMLLLSDSERYQHGLVEGAWRGESTLEAERRIFGFDHAALSAALLRHWEIPESVCALVETHHAPDSLEGRIVAMGDRMAEVLSIGMESVELQKAEVAAQNQLGIHSAVFSSLMFELQDRADELAELFGVHSGAENSPPPRTSQRAVFLQTTHHA